MFKDSRSFIAISTFSRTNKSMDTIFARPIVSDEQMRRTHPALSACRLCSTTPRETQGDEPNTQMFSSRSKPRVLVFTKYIYIYMIICIYIYIYIHLRCHSGDLPLFEPQPSSSYSFRRLEKVATVGASTEKKRAAPHLWEGTPSSWPLKAQAKGRRHFAGPKP